VPRNIARNSLVLLAIFLAIFVPLIVSGYSELQKATVSSSYLETAGHYRRAAQRLPWRADLYELAGHAYYYAKDYVQADASIKKPFPAMLLRRKDG